MVFGVSAQYKNHQSFFASISTANAEVKVDKRVIDIVRNIEDKDAIKPTSDELARKASFMRTGPANTVKSTKPDEKEKEQISDKSIPQQLKNVSVLNFSDLLFNGHLVN